MASCRNTDVLTCNDSGAASSNGLFFLNSMQQPSHEHGVLIGQDGFKRGLIMMLGNAGSIYSEPVRDAWKLLWNVWTPSTITLEGFNHVVNRSLAFACLSLSLPLLVLPFFSSSTSYSIGDPRASSGCTLNPFAQLLRLAPPRRVEVPLQIGDPFFSTIPTTNLTGMHLPSQPPSSSTGARNSCTYLCLPQFHTNPLHTIKKPSDTQLSSTAA